MSRSLKAAVNAVMRGGLGRSWRSSFDIDAWVDGPDASSRFLVDPEQYRRTLFALLRAAEKDIAVECYIVEDDAFSAELFTVLREAAERGVRVRMIADGFGSRAWLQSRLEELREWPIHFRVYHPLPWALPSRSRSSYLVRDLFNHFVTFNRRDHRKLVLIDGRCAVLGSHNIWEESLQWHEASLVLGDASARALSESFERVWLRSSELDGSRPSLLRGRVNAPGRKGLPAREGILDNTTLRFARLRHKAILALLAKAKSRLWITTPYLMPHRTFLRQIKARAEAGVDVKLILPRRSDVRLSRWMAQSLYHDLLRSGVSIHEFTGSILHAKVMVADDRFLLGSSNLNHRSFFQDLEIDYLGQDPALLAAIIEWKQRTLQQCEQITDVGQIPLHALKRCIAGVLNPLRGYF